LRAADPSPAESAEASAERALLHRALGNLGGKCTEIIRLHYFEGWPYARIADREGRSEATMRGRMFECMRALRALMRRSEAGVP
jgi:RNA polymerase sigma factor (sigma-70 family)